MAPAKTKVDEKLQGKHILVVEDDPLMAALLEELLKRYDHASYVHSGREALREVERQPPDIVLLDISLPDIHGLEVARELRKNKKTRTIPILAMSGLLIGKEEWSRAGCNDFILKPFDTSQLLGRLAALV